MTMTVLIFVFNGIIGALLHILLHDQVEDMKALMKDILIGGLAGYVYYNLHYSYAFPDGIIAIIIGYFAKDIIYVLFEKKIRGIIQVLLGGEHG